MIERLSLSKFTVFDDCEVELSPRVNIIIGENGSGKTHLLKAAYALSVWDQGDNRRPAEVTHEELGERFSKKLLRLFFTTDDPLKTLQRRGGRGKTTLSVVFPDGRNVGFSFGSTSEAAEMIQGSQLSDDEKIPVFIPAKEVLSFLSGMSSPTTDKNTVRQLFDDSYLDLCDQIQKNAAKGSASELDLKPRLGVLIPAIVNSIGGRYILKDSKLTFQPGSYEETNEIRQSDPDLELEAPQLGSKIKTKFVPSSKKSLPAQVTAEGHKKLGMLQQLLLNEEVSPGKSGTMFWDEPEANINPKLMRTIVEAILNLSRNGQQVVIATHDYVLLKWFDLLVDKAQQDHVRFHVLKGDAATGVSIKSSDSYQNISSNAIADTFSELYDEEINRSFEVTK